MNDNQGNRTMGLTTRTTSPSGEVCMHDSQVMCLIFQKLNLFCLIFYWEFGRTDVDIQYSFPQIQRNPYVKHKRDLNISISKLVPVILSTDPSPLNTGCHLFYHKIPLLAATRSFIIVVVTVYPAPTKSSPQPRTLFIPAQYQLEALHLRLLSKITSSFQIFQPVLYMSF